MSHVRGADIIPRLTGPGELQELQGASAAGSCWLFLYLIRQPANVQRLGVTILSSGGRLAPLFVILNCHFHALPARER